MQDREQEARPPLDVAGCSGTYIGYSTTYRCPLPQVSKLSTMFSSARKGKQRSGLTPSYCLCLGTPGGLGTLSPAALSSCGALPFPGRGSPHTQEYTQELTGLALQC